jgi:hypothetical protein
MRFSQPFLLWGIHSLINKECNALLTTSNNRRLPRGYSGNKQTKVLPLYATADNDESPNGPKRKAKRKKKVSSKRKSASKLEERNKKKEQVMKQLKAKLEEKKKFDDQNKKGLLNKLNPFQAGQSLRKTIGDLGSLSTLAGSGLSDRTKQKYYLDDRFLDGAGSSALLTERNPYLERLERDNYVPEVLVVGATGEVGRLVVRRLLLEGRFRVRVLVRGAFWLDFLV